MNKLPFQLRNEEFNFIRVVGKNPSINGEEWQKEIHSYKEAMGWLSQGQNYGVMGGHGGLIILDADSQAIIAIAETELPATFTVQTGSGKRHYYFLCPDLKKKVTFNDKLSPSLFQEGEDHYGEIITWGFQAVGPGSIHPQTKRLYTVLKNKPIVSLEKETLLSALSFFLKPVEAHPLPHTSSYLPQGEGIASLRISDLISLQKSGNIVHPVHGATNGGNLSLSLEKNLWYCFRCESGGGPASLLAVMEGIITCDEAVKGGLRGEKFVQLLDVYQKKFGETVVNEKKKEEEEPSPPGAPRFPTLTFAELMGREFPKEQFVIEPFFETHTVNMLSAPPNMWKSWLIFLFATHIASETPFLGKFTTEKNKVMVVNEEDSYRSVQKRFKLLGITDTSLDIHFRIAQGAKLEEKFIREILEECKEKEISVVMFDSLRALHNASENDSTEMQAIMDYFKTLARNNITIIFTHHHRKKSQFQKGDDAEATRGSSAINAAISGHVSLEEEVRESGRVLIIRHLKSKAGEKIEPFEIKIIKKEGENFEENPDDYMMQFLYDGDLKTGERKLAQTKDKILYSMLGVTEWKTVKDFMEAGIAGKNIIRDALKSLVAEGELMAMSRKEAQNKRIKIETTGKPNEMLYAKPKKKVEQQEEEEIELEF